MSNEEVKAGKKIGKFRIEKKLGAGGMASVYLATDLVLSRKVALKLLEQDKLVQSENKVLSENLKDRFIREAQTAALINHQNLAQLYEASFEEDNWFIAMEYIEGATIGEYLEKGKEFSINEIVNIMVQVTKRVKICMG